MGTALRRLRRATFDPRAWGLTAVLLAAYAVPFLLAPDGRGPLVVLSTAVMLPYYVSMAVPFLLIGGATAFWIGFVFYCFSLGVGVVAFTDWLQLRRHGSTTESH